MKYRKGTKLDKAARKARREARRQAAQVRQQAKSPKRVLEAAKELAKHDPKFARHLEATATRILHDDVRRRIAEQERKNGVVKVVDPRIKLQAAQQRAEAIARARVIRHGRHVWFISGYTKDRTDSDGKIVPGVPTWVRREFPSINAARKEAGLGAVVIGDREPLPSFLGGV